ncbi:MAG: type IX secretion system protein PorQ [Bacteroidetes bacterium]|nr:type IX secretion system protein PorQ [Bacteroidota bacterium]
MRFFTKNTFLFVLLAASGLPAFSQIGGKGTYQFLNLTNSPRAAATGGYFVPVMDNDESQVYANPSLLSKQMDNRLVLNYVNYIGDINYGYTGYIKDFDKYGTFSLGINYFNYGSFIQADETAQILGAFTASESALNIGWGHKIKERFSIGSNLKLVYSQLFQYKSVGMAMDFAGTYYNPDRGFGASIVVRNVGTQFTTYVPGNKEPLPLDFQVGISKKLAHAPFRFVIVGHNLQTKSIWFQNLGDKSQTSSLFNADSTATTSKSNLGQEIARRATLGVEFVPVESFALRVGYNYQRQQEMKLGGDNKLGMVGFSLGLQIKIKMLTFQYAWASYSVAGSAHFLSVSAKVSDFKKSKKEEAK